MYHASTKPSIESRNFPVIALALAVSLLSACDASSPTGASATTDVRPDPAVISKYFSEAEKRANLWFCGTPTSGRSCDAMPVLPSFSEVMNNVRFVEEAPNGQTCYYDGATDIITIPADKWNSGCVPHELLHASLHMIGNHCWRDVEHNPYEGSCRS